MLTINFDPEYPQEALDTCSFLVELVCDYASTPRDLDIPDGAQAGISEIGSAVLKAHEAVGAALRASRGSAGIHPAAPAPAPAAAPAGKATEVMGQAADLMGAVLATIRTAPAASEQPGACADRNDRVSTGGGLDAPPPRYTLDDLVRAARRMAAEGAMTKAELRAMLDAAGIEDDAGNATEPTAAPRLTKRRENKPPASDASAA